MKIELLHEAVFSEPPPNIVISATADEFRLLADAVLQIQDFIALHELPNARILGGLETFVLRKSSDQSLARIQGEHVDVSLNGENWQRFSEIIRQLREPGSFAYIDFDDLDLSEEANLIMRVAPDLD
jgi:hypothetical protein